MRVNRRRRRLAGVLALLALAALGLPGIASAAEEWPTDPPPPPEPPPNCRQQDHQLTGVSLVVGVPLATMTSHIKWCWNSNGMTSVVAYAPTSLVPAHPNVTITLASSDGPGHVDTNGVGHFSVSALLKHTVIENIGPLTHSCQMTIDAELRAGGVSEYYDVNGCTTLWGTGSEQPGVEAVALYEPPAPQTPWWDWPLDVVHLDVDETPEYGEVVSVKISDPVTGELIDAVPVHEWGHGGGSFDPVWDPYFGDDHWFDCLGYAVDEALAQ